jgi:hypothetical protein
MAWLRWGLIQADGVRVAHAIASLQRSLDLGGTGPAQDAQVREIIAELHRGLPGGDLAQEQLKLGTSAAPSPTRPRSP